MFSRNLKLCLIGDSETGKSTFIEILKDKDTISLPDLCPTNKAFVHTLNLTLLRASSFEETSNFQRKLAFEETSNFQRKLAFEETSNFQRKLAFEETSKVTSEIRSEIYIDVWDCAGKKELSGLGEAYYIQADAAILFADNTNSKSYESLDKWAKSFKSVFPNAKIVIVGNKYDRATSDNRKYKNYIKMMTGKKPGYFPKYFDISNKTRYNIQKSLTYIFQQIFQDQSITVASC